jgi:hypothetical protein
MTLSERSIENLDAPRSPQKSRSFAAWVSGLAGAELTHQAAAKVDPRKRAILKYFAFYIQCSMSMFDVRALKSSELERQHSLDQTSNF